MKQNKTICVSYSSINQVIEIIDKLIGIIIIQMVKQLCIIFKF